MEHGQENSFYKRFSVPAPSAGKRHLPKKDGHSAPGTAIGAKK
jgi:hypothetical protein